MNRWKGIVEFVAVVEAGSFSKAADNLDIAVSQISKRIHELETRLDTQLIYRSTRKIKLSPQGEAFYQTCKQIMQELENVEESLGSAQNTAVGKLKLCCVNISHPKILISIFSEFLKKHPKINVEFLFSDAMPNLLEAGADLALVVGDVDEEAYYAVRLTWIEYYLVASPTFIAEHGAPLSPKDLEDFPCIINHSNIWRLSNETDNVSVSIEGQWSSANGAACTEACINGMGIFMVPSFAFEGLAQKQKLQRVLSGWSIRKPLMAAGSYGRGMNEKMRLFLTFLESIMSTNPPSGVSALSEMIQSNKSRKKLIKDIKDTLEREVTLLP